jgi:XTP/dITP diphosphohydrolase
MNNLSLLIATTNPGKSREFRELLGDQFDYTDLSEVSSAPSVEETGLTFRENACLKASAYARHFNRWTLADDSGLEVDALQGDPGVLSARWSEIHDAGKGDADNNKLLLHQLQQIPAEQRTARFVCVLALSDPTGRIVFTARDTVEGHVLHAARGSNGFGYDPLFLIASLGKTTAELSSEKKHEISHRGKALRRLRQLMDARSSIVPG